MDSICEAALARVRQSVRDLRAIVQGLPAEALNWRPVPDTNSIAAQIEHSLKSAEFYLRAAAATDRDMGTYLDVREGTFNFGADGPALLAMLDRFDLGLDHAFAAIDPGRYDEVIDWSEHGRGRPSVAWVLLGVVEHLREHVGASALTRQLWEQSHPR